MTSAMTIPHAKFLVSLVALFFIRGSEILQAQQKRLSAPTYYLSGDVHECSSEELLVKGASNLPAGSIIAVQASEFDGAGWRDYSNPAFVTLRNDGFFEATIHPLPKLAFHGNLLARIYFSPGYHKQPAS